MCPIGGRLVASTFTGSGGLLSRARLVCHCLLIEGAHGLILCDTGFGTADLAAAKQRLGGFFVLSTGLVLDPGQTALAQIKALGFRPEDVRDIVVTHLDLDHAGGLSDFPKARVHVHRTEHAAAHLPQGFIASQRYKPVQWAHGPDWRLYETAGDRWLGFEAVRLLSPLDDVLLVPLQGHTRGHSGIAVRDERGWLLHAGDSYFDEREVADPPYCPPAIAAYQRLMATDDGLRRRNQERLRGLHHEHPEIRLFCAHSAAELKQLTE